MIILDIISVIIVDIVVFGILNFTYGRIRAMGRKEAIELILVSLVVITSIIATCLLSNGIIIIIKTWT